MRKAFLIILALLPLVLSAKKPTIGISSGFTTDSSSSILSTNYTISVTRAGGIPVVIPLVRTGQEAYDIISILDGIIFSGGEDINPAYYGEAKDSTVKVNATRDTSDFLLFNAALKAGIPILGICRGEQLINVALGGSLVQDIPSQIKRHIRHSQKESKAVATQTVRFKKGSRLAELLGDGPVGINSFHHQSVKQPAPGLKVVATTKDGVVEAYEGFPKYDIIGVQFHPEGFTANGDDRFLPLFKDFTERAGKRHQTN